MKKNNEHGLYSISPTIDYYKEFYLSYHKRKNPILAVKENDLPKIKNLKTEISAQNAKYDNINNLITTSSVFDSISNIVGNKKANNFNYSSISPFIKTEQICYPKISPALSHIKNYISQNKTKIQKKNGKLSIKYLDIINMDTKNKILVYEIIEKEKLFENEIVNIIKDSLNKNKILDEIRKIDKKTNEQIEKCNKNNTQRRTKIISK